MPETFQVLQPQYFERFRCLGSDCEDTCCDGWGILIDRATYDIYQKTPERALVEINLASRSASDYAKIRLKGTGCPALQGGLCSLHRDHGDPYLSDMCSTFPRVVTLVDGVAEQSLHLSCPEAARLVLLDPDSMKMLRAEAMALEFRLAAVSRVAEPDKDFRERMAATIRDRSRTLPERILKIGQSIEPFQPAVAVSSLEDILELIIGRIGAEYTSPRFLECYGEFMRGLGWTGESTMEELAARYRIALTEYYAPFVALHPYIFENYLLNYMYRTLFPYGWKQADQKMATDTTHEAMKDAYLLMLAHYAIIKTVFIGMAGLYRENLSVDHVVKLVQSATKVFQHSSAFTGVVRDFFAGRPEGGMQAAFSFVTDL